MSGRAFANLLLAAVALAACGNVAPADGDVALPATSTMPQETIAPLQSTPAGETAAPVTPIMEQLQLAGEPYAAIGDPSAPLTVIEFSDYG